MLLYLLIFICKVIETCLGTLRVIVIANGKKVAGAILQLFMAVIWVFVTSIVIVDITEDPFKIVAFAIGCSVGSWLGGYLEEKLALGDNMLMVIIDRDLAKIITDTLRQKGFAVTSMNAEGKDKKRTVLMIMVARKVRHKVINIVKKLDSTSMVVSEVASTLQGGYAE